MILLVLLVGVLVHIRRVRRRRAFERGARKVRTLGPAWGHAREAARLQRLH